MKKPAFDPRLKMKSFIADLDLSFKARLEKIRIDPDSINEIHNSFRRVAGQLDTPWPDMKEVHDFTISSKSHQIPVRLFVPHDASPTKSPCFIYLHGGGFVTGSIESHEGITRRIALNTGIRVLSVDYRLAPKYKYPSALNDCERVLDWALNDSDCQKWGINSNNISLGGDSAGGNMTAYLSQKFRDRLRAQILFYPLMQLIDFKPPNPGPQDWLQLGFMALKFIDEHYVAGADAQQTSLSPLLEDNLKGLPPSYILTCGLDPLRDEGKLYADKLMVNAINVEYNHEKLLPHGFLNFTRLFPKGKIVLKSASDFLLKYIED
jgi:acetyl esterase